MPPAKGPHPLLAASPAPKPGPPRSQAREQRAILAANQRVGELGYQFRLLKMLETSFESTMLATLAIAAMFEDYESMSIERQALFASSLALSSYIMCMLDAQSRAVLALPLTETEETSRWVSVGSTMFGN